MKLAKEWIDKLYSFLHPESKEEDFEKFIRRIQRDSIYSIAWKIQEGGQKMISNYEIRDMIIKIANENRNKES